MFNCQLWGSGAADSHVQAPSLQMSLSWDFHLLLSCFFSLDSYSKKSKDSLFMAKLPRHLRRRHENLGTSSASCLFPLTLFLLWQYWGSNPGPWACWESILPLSYCKHKRRSNSSDDSHTKAGAYPVFYNGKENDNENKALFLNFEKVLLFLGYRKVFDHLPKISWQLRNNLTIHLATVHPVGHVLSLTEHLTVR